MTSRSRREGMFLDFFGKNSIFLLFFKQKVGSCPPPWKNFALPWKKVCGRPWSGQVEFMGDKLFCFLNCLYHHQPFELFTFEILKLCRSSFFLIWIFFINEEEFSQSTFFKEIILIQCSSNTYCSKKHLIRISHS